MVARLTRSLVILLAGIATLSSAAAGEVSKAAGFYEDGLQRFNKGDVAGAVIQLKNALQQDGKMLAAQVLLARALLEQVEYAAADAAFNEAIKLGVGRSEIAAPRGRLLMALGRTKPLLAEIHPDGLRGDDLVEVLTLRAKAHAIEGDDEEALKGFAAAIDTDPSSVRPYQDLVPYLIQRGDIKGAESRVGRLAVIAPDNAEVWNLRASLHHVRGQLRAALESYDKALERDPAHIDARVARAAINLDLGRQDEARKDLDVLKERAKREPRSAYLRAVLAGSLGRDAEAREALVEVAALVDALPAEYSRANEQLLMLGALSHHGLGSSEKASEYLDTLLKRFPQNMGGRKLLASIYLDQQDSSRALAALEPVLRNSPDDPQANLLAGRAQLGMNRYRQAGEYLEKAVQRLGSSPEALAALGASFIGRGMEPEGIARLEQAMRAGPGDLATGSVLASLYMKRGEADKALALAESLVGKSGRNPLAMNLLASIRGARGERDAARDIYLQILAKDPEYLPAALNLARLETESGDVDAARRRLAALQQRRPDDPRPMYEMGLLERQAGRPDKALEWLQKAYDKKPDEPRVALAIVETHSAAGRHEAALEVAKALAIRYPDDLAIQAVLGQAFLAASDARSARQVFRGMTRTAEFDAEAQVRIGRLLLAAGFPEDAEYNAQKAVQAKAGYPPAFELMIDVAVARGQSAAAREALASLRQVAPELPDLPRYEGTIHLADGNLPAAVKAFRQAHLSTPSARSALNLSSVLRRSDQPDEALKVLLAELRRDQSPAVLRGLSDLHVAGGRWQEARQVLTRLSELQPDDPDLLNQLALVQLQLGEKAALGTAEKALALAPRHPGIIDTVGWVKLQRGDVEGALAMLRDARLRAPQDQEIRFHLAVALERSGRAGEAKAELDVALAGQPDFHGVDDARALQRRLAR